MSRSTKSPNTGTEFLLKWIRLLNKHFFSCFFEKLWELRIGISMQCNAVQNFFLLRNWQENCKKLKKKSFLQIHNKCSNGGKVILNSKLKPFRINYLLTYLEYAIFRETFFRWYYGSFWNWDNYKQATRI